MFVPTPPPSPAGSGEGAVWFDSFVRPILTGKSCSSLCPYSHCVGGAPLMFDWLKHKSGSPHRVEATNAMGTRQESRWFG